LTVSTIKDSIKSQRSLEQEKYNIMSKSLTRYERIRKDFEDEIQNLQNKNLILQQEVNMKDEIIYKQQILTKQSQSKNIFITILEMGFSAISNKPKSKMMRNNTNLKLKATQFSSQNNSFAKLEDHSVLKTPEISGKNQVKGRKTAKVNKQNKLEMKMSPSVNIKNQRINLSDILKTSEYDQSEYPCLLDDINISSELVSLSYNEQDIYMPSYALNTDEENLPTPNFPNRVQSKIPNIRQGDDLDDSKENVFFDGKHLDMGLGDIPEEHEENMTTSEN
jgi:hypothetical protein